MRGRLHGGHGLAVGFVAGIAAAEYRMWLLLALAFLLGAAFALAVERVNRLVRWLDRSISPLTMRQWRALRRRVDTLRPDDTLPF